MAVGGDGHWKTDSKPEPGTGRDMTVTAPTLTRNYYLGHRRLLGTTKEEVAHLQTKVGRSETKT